LTTSAACRLAGVSRATWYRRQQVTRPTRSPIPQKQRVQPAALSADERAAILAHLSDEDSADLSVSQLFHRLWDEEIYIASESSWHRIAREHKLTGDRRRQATHSAKAIPVLCASRPNQVWSWDITVLPSIDRGRNFRLYVILDVFSRFVVGWRLEDNEKSLLAVQMLDTSIAAHAKPDVLHADRGSPMTGNEMTTFLATNNIIQSHSRPHVSNDNPFSEAQFKTMKYGLDYPGRFTDLAHARDWTANFVTAYNTQHRHSGIGHYTPESVHDGTWTALQRRRQHTIDAAAARHPQRFTRPPRAPHIASHSWINKPHDLSHAA
jgi:putative transposase